MNSDCVISSDIYCYLAVVPLAN